MSDASAASESRILDLSSLSEEQTLAFYGSLFAMSAVDRDMDEAESDLIFESLDLDSLSPDARRSVLGLAISPPALDTCLRQLAGADREIRFGLMLNLVATALADDALDVAEHAGLRHAQQVLGISDEDVSMMHEQAYKAQLAGQTQRPIRFEDPAQQDEDDAA
jgi:uncharacterized tellurite resistance protein B-like protein